MSDFHEKLRDALKSVGESFRPEDIAAKQREFLYRRKRRRAAYAGGTLAFGAAVLAAVLFVTSGTTPVADKEPSPPAANPVPIITDVIRVGDGPSGIDVGSSGVWVANLNGDTVTRIDPTTNTVIDSVRVADAPDDLAVGEDLVWVGDDPGAENSALFGSISIVHGRSGELIDSRLALTREGQTESSLELGHIDLVANGNDLWAVTEAVPGPKVFQGEGLGGSYEADGFSPREIAIDDDAVWAFDAAHERLSSFSLPNGSEGGFHPVADVPRLADSQNDDLAAGLGAVWLTQGGILARIDRDSGEITSRIDLPGNFAALALGEGYVWAMSADSVDDSDLGWLTQIEPDTGKAIGEPLEIDGKPADVAVGGGAVWVTQHDADTVTRIE
ncbi:MAG: hypothetical protein QOH26_1905, partial [Actinomycetota bacterium]|nr:hypothetical protein [Actinomycetota bacterium]